MVSACLFVRFVVSENIGILDDKYVCYCRNVVFHECLLPYNCIYEIVRFIKLGTGLQLEEHCIYI